MAEIQDERAALKAFEAEGNIDESAVKARIKAEVQEFRRNLKQNLAKDRAAAREKKRNLENRLKYRLGGLVFKSGLQYVPDEDLLKILELGARHLQAAKVQAATPSPTSVDIPSPPSRPAPPTPAVPPPPAAPTQSGGPVDTKIVFSSDPGQAVTQTMQARGFRYHEGSWFGKDVPANVKQALTTAMAAEGRTTDYKIGI